MRSRALWGLLPLLVSALAGCGSGSGSGSGGDALAQSAAPRLWEAHPPLHVHRFAATTPAGYTPAQMRQAYGFNQIGGDGSGQTIAIIDAYGSPTIANDIKVFCSQFGLPACNLTIAYPQGQATKNAGWALETALDVEWAHAIAPGARILLVVAKTASFNNLLAAVDYAVSQGATQVSMSWGGLEFSSEALYDSHFSSANVTFLASSGDSGAGVEWPSASPNVVAVGGTTLTLGGGVTETAWSGSGGGQSAYEAEPSFQSLWQASKKRQVPDVAYNANPNTGVPVYDSTAYNGVKGWFQVGGTSAGAPQWAALCALAKSASATGHTPGNAAIYALSGSTTYATNYRDIISGSNGLTAATGYDMVTGIGSPLANNLIPALASY